ncbi:MAG TPA: response regulator [Candidatus Acidoferrales bacterium]|nr:response regulator [Candidatus Acidoferrales bacterium]
MSGKRVLVVDDDQDIRELLVSVLEDDGYQAESAQNGREALEVLERWKADVVVLDLMMPVMDGWTFADRMHEKWDIPIVVISAATDLKRHAGRVGAAGVVAKPFEIESLLPVIARVSTTSNGTNASF